MKAIKVEETEAFIEAYETEKCLWDVVPSIIKIGTKSRKHCHVYVLDYIQISISLE